MSQIFKGRYTAHTDQPFTVFIIGMRINKLAAVSRWLPTMRAMGPMLKSLYKDPGKGFLGGQQFLYPRGVALVTYWRSFEDLERFARDPGDAHLPAWKRFNQSVGADGSVGIWHETYLVPAGQYETLYGNMPAFGLAAATEHVPAVGRRETARRRLGGANEPAVPAPALP